MTKHEDYADLRRWAGEIQRIRHAMLCHDLEPKAESYLSDALDLLSLGVRALERCASEVLGVANRGRPLTRASATTNATRAAAPVSECDQAPGGDQ